MSFNYDSFGDHSFRNKLKLINNFYNNFIIKFFEDLFEQLIKKNPIIKNIKALLFNEFLKIYKIKFDDSLKKWKENSSLDFQYIFFLTINCKEDFNGIIPSLDLSIEDLKLNFRIHYFRQVSELNKKIITTIKMYPTPEGKQEEYLNILGELVEEFLNLYD